MRFIACPADTVYHSPKAGGILKPLTALFRVILSVSGTEKSVFARCSERWHGRCFASAFHEMLVLHRLTAYFINCQTTGLPDRRMNTLCHFKSNQKADGLPGISGQSHRRFKRVWTDLPLNDGRRVSHGYFHTFRTGANR